MIIAIPISSASASAKLSAKFARSPFFAIVNKDDNSVQIFENPFLELETGIGNKLVDQLVNLYAVDTLMAFELGVKVQQIATEKQLQLIVIHQQNKTLKQLLNMFRQNK